MGVTNANKELSVSRIDCGGSFSLKLSLTAEPNILTNPVDIVLILDRSGSMAGSPLANLKSGAKKFIDIIDEATDGEKNGEIGYGSRIGIVSFSGTATQDTQLITSVDDLKTAVNELETDRLTNHADTFSKALDMFDSESTNQKIMVMFTDGKTTFGDDPNAVASLAKSQGVIIYCIGLSGNGGIDEQALRDWASDPDSAYVSITPDDEELEKLFEDLATNISKPGATDIIVTDEIAPCFRITAIHTPTKGSASMLGANTVEWKINKLGVSKSEGAELKIDLVHIGPCSGNVEVNEDITYEDKEKNKVTFPSPHIYVDCGTVIRPESCPVPVNLSIDGCEDTLEFDAGDLAMQSLGRILQVDITLKSVCPHRRVALAVMLNETDSSGNEYERGMKIMTVPAHTADVCRDIKVRCVKFVLPEDLDVSGQPNSICNERSFKARFIAHYIDSGYDCCTSTV